MAPKNKASADAGEYNRAVIYARFSEGPNQREESITGQVRECKEIAKRHGLVVCNVYADRRLSGTSDARPEFQRMLRDADRGQFDVVITWKNDRFARNRYDLAVYKQRLKRNGIRIIYAREIIPDGPEGIILESVLEGMAEYYSANLSENIRRGQRDNALQGKFIGGAIPFGFKLDAAKRYIIDKEKAPLVLEIFRRYAGGDSIMSIVDDLNSRGFTTGQGRPFNRSSLTRMLNNKKYTGVYIYKDLVNMDAIPRIISDELFSQAQRRSEINKRTRRSNENSRVNFLLTGKIYCGHCGEPMSGTSGTSRNGERFYYYNCQGVRKKNGCHKKPVKKDFIEKLVANVAVDKIINDCAIVDKIVDRCLEIQLKEIENSPANGLRRELKNVEKSIANILKAIEAGIFTDSTKERLLQLEERRGELRQAIAAADIRPPALTREQLLFMFEKFRGRDSRSPDFIREIIDTFIAKIFLFDDRLVITFNLSDDNTEQISLADLRDPTKLSGVGGSTFDALTPPNELKQNTAVFFKNSTSFGVCYYYSI